MTNQNLALIVGAGFGLSASVARLLYRNGWKVILFSRNDKKLSSLCKEIDAISFSGDASDKDAISKLFENIDNNIGSPNFVLYNPSYRVRQPFLELDPEDVSRAIQISALGGFFVGQQAAKRMLASGDGGAIFFTGASASVKGYSQSAPFAMGKFALRGLSQSMARELHPKGIHIAHFVIDGSIRSKNRTENKEKPDSLLDPDAIAQTYLNILNQPRNSWTSEIEIRPWVEQF